MHAMPDCWRWQPVVQMMDRIGSSSAHMHRPRPSPGGNAPSRLAAILLPRAPRADSHSQTHWQGLDLCGNLALPHIGGVDPTCDIPPPGVIRRCSVCKVFLSLLAHSKGISGCLALQRPSNHDKRCQPLSVISLSEIGMYQQGLSMSSRGASAHCTAPLVLHPPSLLSADCSSVCSGLVCIDQSQ